jgi:H+/Na+-translocating ferredoxin:NAD+ oxidoreductase subunit G
MSDLERGDSNMGAPEAPVRVDTPSWRLIATLSFAGVIAGLLIVLVHLWTEPRILEHHAVALRAAVQEVLGDPARTETLYLIDEALTPNLPPGVDSLDVERVFVGYDEEGQRLGLAIKGAEPGFQDVINLIFGYDPAERRLLGMKVLDNKETPGLGDKIVKDSAFVSEFVGVSVPMVGVNIARSSGAPHEVDMITGATISSRAVIAIINHQLEALGPVLDSYFGGGT